MYLSVLHVHMRGNIRCYGQPNTERNCPTRKGGYTRSRFSNMRLSVVREHLSCNTRCYGNGRTRIVFAAPVFAEKKDQAQTRVRCIEIFRNSF